MGRPYKMELSHVPTTLEWAINANISAVQEIVATVSPRPLIVIGSGGSITACHLVARLHADYARQPARVLTPQEFSLLPSDEISSVWLLSASGSNTDILHAAKKAMDESY